MYECIFGPYRGYDVLYASNINGWGISIISIDKNWSYFSKLFEKQRRCKELESKKLLFVGSGVSGGEDGARYGPSLMPGGSDAAWYVVHNT